MTLTETTRIVEEIQYSIIKTFKTANTLVIPHILATLNLLILLLLMVDIQLY